MTSGTLYLVATPIGNLEDITLRAIRILKSVDMVACEDTRRARVLLHRHGIRARLVSYYGAREKEKARRLLKNLEEGKDAALISDAGMPGISDPGSLIIEAAIKEGIAVVPVPGPSAVVTALAASGLPTRRFVFEGFLPRKASERTMRLLDLAGEERTMIFYESPRRLKQTLEEMRIVMGERSAVIVREMTKVHEEFIRGTLSSLLERFSGREPRGEVVIVLCGCEEGIDWKRVDIPAYFEMLREKMGLDKKSALTLVARLSGISKSVIYKDLLDRR